MTSNLKDTHLSDWTVEEKISAVKSIFSSITPKYDRMNHILSARQDIRWRKFMVKRLPVNAEKVLDVATGTGDVAIEIKKRRPSIKVTGVDFVMEMMKTAKVKTSRQDLKIDYSGGDAMCLPFKDNTFDAATIAFGLRNIPDRLGAIKEMARVVKSGGKVMTLEMTFPRNLKMRKFFDWYLNNIIPRLGAMIARDPKAYRYLVDSIQDFIHPDILTSIFKDAGLKSIREFPLTLGITYLHEGIV